MLPMLGMHDIYKVNISEILAVTTLFLLDTFTKYVLPSPVPCTKPCVDSRPGCREMVRNVMLTIFEMLCPSNVMLTFSI